MSIKSKQSFSEKISSILNAAPVSIDPEDEADETSAKVTNYDNEQDNDEELLSSFRKQNVDMLADIDSRYAGKKGNRKKFEDSDSGEYSESEISVEGSDAQDTTEDGINSDSKSCSEKSDVSADDTDNDDDISGEEGESNTDSDDLESLKSNDDDSNFKHIKETNLSSEVKKGLAIRNQINIWENLLEMRIQLQKCLLAANKMPQSDYYREIKEESGSEFTDKVEETSNNLQNVLDKMILFQKMMVQRYPETRKLGKDKEKNKVLDDDDEEIPSDTDEDIEPEEGDNEIDESPKKRKKLNDYEEDISYFHTMYQDYRNSVIEKWNNKTRLSITKNSSQTHSIIDQIVHTLKDKTRLIKKTQTKKADYQILGQEESLEDRLENIEEHNKEIFDDTDFYHQLLRELIEVKSADITDPIQLGRQWIQLQNLRSKMKRNIDTRATKGRKIRYTVHTKLVNFMAPIINDSWTEDAKTELYNSLFGKNQPKIS